MFFDALLANLDALAILVAAIALTPVLNEFGKYLKDSQ